MFGFIRVCIKVLRISVFRIKIIKCVCVELVPNSRFLARRSDANETISRDQEIRPPWDKKRQGHSIKLRGKSRGIFKCLFGDRPKQWFKTVQGLKQSYEITRGSRESQALAEGQAQSWDLQEKTRWDFFGFGLPRPTNTTSPGSAQTFVCLSLSDANLLAPIAENIKYHHEME